MPTLPFAHEDLKRILVDRIGLSEDDIPDELDTTFEDLGLDSLARVEVVLAVQQEYDLVVSDEDARALVTLGDAVNYVNERLMEKETV